MTGRWRPLPAALDPDVAYLVGLLRELKDRSGLSLAALAAQTPYSKSSWERYLNGATLPPRHAVEALGRLAGEPADRLLALWEQAETRWSGRAATAQPSTVQPPAAEP
ncbi:helix-turn-helix domain-containing protein, partial [Pseudonocardia acidicola]